MPRTRKIDNDPLDDLLTETVASAPVTGPTPVDKAPKAAGGKRKKVTKEMAMAVVTAINLPLSMIPLTSADALDGVECQALANAIEDTARANKWFANIILNIVTVQSTAELGIVVSAIVAKRLARREKLPLIAALVADSAIASVASRGASVTGRSDRERQDDVSPESANGPAVLFRTAD